MLDNLQSLYKNEQGWNALTMLPGASPPAEELGIELVWICLVRLDKEGVKVLLTPTASSGSLFPL